jgi:hypothetical protein
VTPSDRELLDRIMAGADVWRLPDGWVGVDHLGLKRQVSPEKWQRLRGEGLPLPDPAGLRRLGFDAWYAEPQHLAPVVPKGGKPKAPPPPPPETPARRPQGAAVAGYAQAPPPPPQGAARPAPGRRTMLGRPA